MNSVSSSASKPQLMYRSQSSSSARRQRKKKARKRYSAGRRIQRDESHLSGRDEVDFVPGKAGTFEKRLHAMKEWRIWQAIAYMFAWLFKSKEDILREEELRVLQRFTSTSCWSQFISISNRVEIRTIKFDLGFSKNRPAIVLLHGFSAGLGVWAPCFDYLCQKCPVYALDLPGFGRSSRVPFSGSSSDIEYQYVCYIDEWRDAVGLENFILVGHGFGGYIATLYALRHPERTRHLVLVEPWGFTELPFGLVRKRRRGVFKDTGTTYKEQLPWLVRKANDLINFFHPLYFLRFVPSFLGKWLVQRFLCASPAATEQEQCSLNSDAKSKDVSLRAVKELSFSSKNYLWGCTSSYRYMYNCNLLRPTGIDAFAKLNLFYFWAANPLVYKIQTMDPEVPISFIYGGSSAVDHKTGYEVYHLLAESFVEVFMIHDAGHNTFIDNPQKFCDILITILESNIARQRSQNDSFEGVSYDYDDLYWDCAWETLNLSRNNLFFPDDEGDIYETDALSEDWEMDDYELPCDEAPEKRYYLAPQISGIYNTRTDYSRSVTNDSFEVQDVGTQNYHHDHGEGDYEKTLKQDFLDLR